MKYLAKSFINILPLNLQQHFLNFWRNHHWRFSLVKRFVKEYFQSYRRLNTDSTRTKPYVIYMTGMPRTGSSFMKNYLADFEGLKINPFQPAGFFITWKQSLEENDAIFVDKSTHYIRHFNKVVAACRNNALYACIVRDPRDQLASLFEFERHPELPRDTRFWKKWHKQYNYFFKIASAYPACKFFFIRYEDLARYPVESKNSFLEWAGLSTNGKVISNEYRVAHRDDVQDDKVKKGSTSSTSSIGRFKTVNDPELINVIEAFKNIPEVRDLMAKFGYLPELGKPEMEYSENIIFFRP